MDPELQRLLNAIIDEYQALVSEDRQNLIDCIKESAGLEY